MFITLSEQVDGYLQLLVRMRGRHSAVVYPKVLHASVELQEALTRHEPEPDDVRCVHRIILLIKRCQRQLRTRSSQAIRYVLVAAVHVLVQYPQCKPRYGWSVHKTEQDGVIQLRMTRRTALRQISRVHLQLAKFPELEQYL